MAREQWMTPGTKVRCRFVANWVPGVMREGRGTYNMDTEETTPGLPYIDLEDGTKWEGPIDMLRQAVAAGQVVIEGPPDSLETQAKQVKLKEKKEIKNSRGEVVTHETWTAPSKAAAMTYLNQREVAEDNYYVNVETPEGTWQKGKHGGIRRY